MLLQSCAKRYLRRVKPYTIGITGSIGKTSCRMILSQVLDISLQDVGVSTSPKNFNSETWLALSILDIQSFTPSVSWSISALFSAVYAGFFGKKKDVIVLEYGIDSPGDMDELLAVCRPHCAVFTGLDKVHAEAFESPDEILTEKAKLLTAAKELVLYPAHASYINKILPDIYVDVLSYWFSVEEESDIWFDQYHLTKDAGENIYSEFVIDQWVEHLMELKTTLIGKISAWYTSLWVQLAMILAKRLWVEATFPDVFEFALQPGRRTMFAWMHSSILIDSTYNAAPESMKYALRQTVALRNELFPEYDIIYCLGDMNELWDFSMSAHQEIASIISQSAEQIFLTWPESRATFDELQKIWYSMKRCTYVDSSLEIWKTLLEYLKSKTTPSLILFKASQWWQFMEEAISQVLLNPEDSQQLPRQEERRKDKKRAYFASVS